MDLWLNATLEKHPNSFFLLRGTRAAYRKIDGVAAAKLHPQTATHPFIEVNWKWIGDAAVE